MNLQPEVLCLIIVVTVLVVRDIYKDIRFYKLEKYVKKCNNSVVYTSIVNMHSYVFDILLTKELIVPPKDFVGSKRKLIFDSVLNIIPEAKDHVKFVDDPSDRIIIGRNNKPTSSNEVQ